jgi:hypothetical protein
MTNNNGAQGGVNGAAHSARTPCYIEFKTAVLELSHAPNPATVVRYLNASRALEGLKPLPRRPAGLLSSQHPNDEHRRGRLAGPAVSGVVRLEHFAEPSAESAVIDQTASAAS